MQCTEALKVESDNERAYFYRGLARLKLHDAKSAVADLKAAGTLGMSPPAVTEVLAAACLAAGDYANSAQYCQQLFSSGKASDDVFLTRGLSLLNMRQHEPALADFEQALKLKPAFVEAPSRRGREYLALGRHLQAIGDLQLALKFESEGGHRQIYSRAGDLLRHQAARAA